MLVAKLAESAIPTECGRRSNSINVKLLAPDFPFLKSQQIQCTCHGSKDPMGMPLPKSTFTMVMYRPWPVEWKGVVGSDLSPGDSKDNIEGYRYR